MPERGSVRRWTLGDVTLIELRGEVDIGNAEEFVELLLTEVARSGARVALDLQQADFIDSTVLNALFSAAPRLRANGGQLVIVCTKQHLGRVLEGAGVDAAYRIVDSPDAALTALGGFREGG